jgi:hypothetical protein
MADFAFFHGNSTLTPAAQPEPKEYQDCIAADGNDGKMAAFMQSFTEGQLTRFLSSSQSCSSFRC